MEGSRRVKLHSGMFCADKAAAGNAYKSRGEAKKAARGMKKRKNGALIHAYKCQYCQMFHIGRSGRR